MGCAVVRPCPKRKPSVRSVKRCGNVNASPARLQPPHRPTANHPERNGGCQSRSLVRTAAVNRTPKQRRRADHPPIRRPPPLSHPSGDCQTNDPTLRSGEPPSTQSTTATRSILKIQVWRPCPRAVNEVARVQRLVTANAALKVGTIQSGPRQHHGSRTILRLGEDRSLPTTCQAACVCPNA
jgi:hypothetical protein